MGATDGVMLALASGDADGEADADGIADSEGDALSGAGTASTGESAASDVVLLSQASSVACLASQV